MREGTRHQEHAWKLYRTLAGKRQDIQRIVDLDTTNIRKNQWPKSKTKEKKGKKSILGIVHVSFISICNCMGLRAIED